MLLDSFNTDYLLDTRSPPQTASALFSFRFGFAGTLQSEAINQAGACRPGLTVNCLAPPSGVEETCPPGSDWRVSVSSWGPEMGQCEQCE